MMLLTPYATKKMAFAVTFFGVSCVLSALFVSSIFTHGHHRHRGVSKSFADEDDALDYHDGSH